MQGNFVGALQRTSTERVAHRMEGARSSNQAAGRCRETLLRGV